MLGGVGKVFGRFLEGLWSAGRFLEAYWKEGHRIPGTLQNTVLKPSSGRFRDPWNLLKDLPETFLREDSWNLQQKTLHFLPEEGSRIPGTFQATFLKPSPGRFLNSCWGIFSWNLPEEGSRKVFGRCSGRFVECWAVLLNAA
eukprot:8371972-Pyramimonas_sp.AAC.1